MPEQVCTICFVNKDIKEYSLYNNGKNRCKNNEYRRKICKDCCKNKRNIKKIKKSHMTKGLSDTQITLRGLADTVQEFIDDPEIVQVLLERMTKYTQWLAIEKKSTKENSVLVNKTDLELDYEKSVTGDANTKIYEKCLYYRNVIFNRLQSEIPADDIHIVLYNKSYLVYIENPKITTYLLSMLK